MHPSRQIPLQAIDAFSRKWNLREFALFGSVLRDDFSPASDVDVLIELHPDHPYSTFELADMHEELERLFARPVDLVLKGGLRNPQRREMILSSRRVMYAA